MDAGNLALVIRAFAAGGMTKRATGAPLFNGPLIATLGEVPPNFRHRTVLKKEAAGVRRQARQ